MERLTNKREADQQRKNYEKRLEQGYPRNIPEERFLKLAAYEDTGMEPYEVLHASKKVDAVFKLTQQIDIKRLEHIKKLAEAENDGRLVELPCKVGDTAWFRTYTKNATVDLGIQPHEVVDIRSYVIVRGEFTDVGIPVEQFGKTAFLTCEEAELVLRKGGDGNVK